MSLFYLCLSSLFQSELFQEDLFPPCMGDQPSVSAEEWIGGVNKDPILISLKEGFVATEKPAFVAPEKKASEEEQVPKGEKEVCGQIVPGGVDIFRHFTFYVIHLSAGLQQLL